MHDIPSGVDFVDHEVTVSAIARKTVAPSQKRGAMAAVDLSGEKCGTIAQCTSA